MQFLSLLSKEDRETQHYRFTLSMQLQNWTCFISLIRIAECYMEQPNG